ncbi:expressed unknown protein [Seminavis robusta]|uniref:Rhodanese domain-containing protein n=1 Tax=Seminavis robusta TaxID=568900 RepID=A0A9N8H5I8_9STRA|nr:expressed unknown protein [Seminavis robusta]|eukprot:Sro75_g041220.1 n/a (181) ;mRNA; r:60888-61430
MSSKRKARSAETTGSRKSSRRGKGGDGKDPSIDNRLADTKPEEILEVFESEELDQGEEDEGEDEEKYGVVILDVRSSEEILKDGFLNTMGANTGEIRKRCFVEWVHVDGSMDAGWKLLKATAFNRFHSCRTPIIVHCATGKKAAEAKKVLTKLNYQCVYNAGAYAALKYLQDYLNGFERK